MPRAPKKCATEGCETRGLTRYCPTHKPMGWQAKGPSRTGTPEHKRWRMAVLYRAGWTCQIKGPGCQGRGAIADHIQPVAWRPDLEFDIDNGQAVCGPCHKAKSLAEATEGRRRGGGTHPLPPGP